MLVTLLASVLLSGTGFNLDVPARAKPIEIYCRGCGCKGGPGWRIHRSGKCASNKNLSKECGSPPSEQLCTYEKGSLSNGGNSTNLLRTPPRAPEPGQMQKVVPSPDIIGRASVIDADTIEIHGERIRIWGIDAPEGMQPCKDATGRDYQCGQVAANALDKHLNEAQPIQCQKRDIDDYGRTVAVCSNSFRQDIAAWLVRNGHALDWPHFSNGKYKNLQSQAQSNRTGIWHGTFTPPWEWRARNQ